MRPEKACSIDPRVRSRCARQGSARSRWPLSRDRAGTAAESVDRGASCRPPDAGPRSARPPRRHDGGRGWCEPRAPPRRMNKPAITGAQHALLFDALVELIGAQAAECPIVIVIEDLHWADAMSARFLAYFGRRVHRLPVLVVGSMRPEDLLDAPILSQALAELRAQGRLDEIPLRALAKDETRLLARCLHARARCGRAGNRMVDDVWMVSEGNPFVVVESMQAIRDEARDRGGSAPRWPGRYRISWRRVWIGSGKGHAHPGGDGGRHRKGLLVRCSWLVRPGSPNVGGRRGRGGGTSAPSGAGPTVGDRLEFFARDWIRRVADRSPASPPTRPDAFTTLPSGRCTGRASTPTDGWTTWRDQLGHHYSRAGDFRKALPYLVRFRSGSRGAKRYALEEALGGRSEHALATVEQLPAFEARACAPSSSAS